MTLRKQPTLTSKLSTMKTQHTAMSLNCAPRKNHTTSQMSLGRIINTSGRILLTVTAFILLQTETSTAFTNPQSSRTTKRSISFNTEHRMSTTTSVNGNTHRTTAKTPSVSSTPVVVSAKAEALSHSKTTMKLVPSYELFQVLPESEGGYTPPITNGNALRYKYRTGIITSEIEDTLTGLQLGDFVGCGGRKKIETLPDPFRMVEKELKPFSDSISELVSSDQPVLSMAAKHFFEKRHGKRFRPTIVQLVAKAVAAAVPEKRMSEPTEENHEANGSSSSPSSTTTIGGVSGWEWSGASKVEAEGGIITPTNHKGSDVWRRQAQLGQIVEMIHVASLIHDDVLDESDTRRGGESVHKLYSNKVAVLAGDYLLARASVLLARLENTAVVQVMATALESLVAGEIMQLKSAPKTLLEMTTYLKKSYYKTASLICYACRSTALLGGHAYSSSVATACEEFGFHLGLAFQIQDDILDFTAAENVLGKPALADMDLGLSTAPILYAAEEYSELRPMVMRRFKNKGDKQAALEFLYKNSTAMDRARNLAQFHAQKAVDAILRLPQSEARDALIRLTHTVITRKK